MDVINVCSFTISGLQQGIDKIAKLCKNWSLNCTPHPKSDGCQEGRGFKKNDSWQMEGHKLEEVREIIYLGVKLKNTGDWRSGEDRNKNQSSSESIVAVHKCLIRMTNLRVRMLEKIYGMIYESRMLCGAEIWGLEWGGKQWKGCRGGLYRKINKNP